ncbi:MAG: hypothetical protein ACLFWM_00830 [Actinomycetota bacterium]
MTPAKPEWDDTGPGRVSIRVPGEGRYIELLRSTVGRAARLSGFTFDGIEDLALAVDEAAVLLLDAEPLMLDLRLGEVGAGTGRMLVFVSMHDPAREWVRDDQLGSDMRWQVLDALCEDVWLMDGRQPGIGLSQTVR